MVIFARHFFFWIQPFSDCFRILNSPHRVWKGIWSRDSAWGDAGREQGQAKKIKIVKSKSPAEMARLEKKKERARKKLEREKKPKKVFFAATLLNYPTHRGIPIHRDFWWNLAKSPSTGPHTENILVLKISKFPTMGLTHTENCENIRVPHYRAHTHGNFENSQILQHRAS